MNYRVVPEALVTAWAGDRLLVFLRDEESTHLLSPEAGVALSVLVERAGVPLGVHDVAGAWPDGHLPPGERELLQVLTGLSQAGIIEQCPRH
ncbi:hypothetical protein [Aquisalimonas sp.]|uniref:hypothetical protein n=1 Tax=unclassified Aquisalimonas TaxID=2644645 RepID=UPI0025C3DB6B|nr:hypothetical protein [Aquisalimonas sp.]